MKCDGARLHLPVGYLFIIKHGCVCSIKTNSKEQVFLWIFIPILLAGNFISDKGCQRLFMRKGGLLEHNDN